MAEGLVVPGSGWSPKQRGSGVLDVDEDAQLRQQSLFCSGGFSFFLSSFPPVLGQEVALDRCCKNSRRLGERSSPRPRAALRLASCVRLKTECVSGNRLGRCSPKTGSVASGSSRKRLLRERVYTDGSGARCTTTRVEDPGRWFLCGGDGHPCAAPG